jgi:hypothetical protein
MKNLQISGLILLFTICCFTSSAQQNPPVNEPDLNKPKLFQDLPERIPVQQATLQSALNATVGQSANLAITANFVYKGQVVSSASKYNNKIESIVIKSSNRIGASFSFSKITNEDGSTVFRGRIISLQHGDGFELVNENGQYFLVKKQFYDMINE